MEKKKKNIPLIIVLDIIFLIIAIICYRYIYLKENDKNKYLIEAESFEQNNEVPTFKIDQIILYNGAYAVDNSENLLQDINVSQFTDIEVYIKNTVKSEEITGENTINELFIDNINIDTESNDGTKIFNYKNPFDCAKYTDISNYQDDGILFNISNTNDEDSTLSYYDNVFFTDCSNPISLGYINKDILKGCTVSSTSGSIKFDGSVLGNASIDLKKISPRISFTIHITNNYNEKFLCNVIIDDDLTYNNSEILTGGSVRYIVPDSDDTSYNFIKLEK